MVLVDVIIFIIAMALLTKGSTLATKHASLLAESFHLSKYLVGFIVIAVISILPETLISVNSALEGIPSFGLGTLFGSNIADLTLIFAILVYYANRGLKVEGKIIKTHTVYPFILLIPLILGLDGYYSRIEGLSLIIIGTVFYLTALKNDVDDTIHFRNDTNRLKHFLFLLFSMTILLVGSHFTVTSATAIASFFAISPVLIAMLIVGLGTTLPELFFSIQCVKGKDDSLAIGDLLGTVLADALIVVGILALISPFSFPLKIIYITGVFMFIASLLLFFFMKTGRLISKKEALFLFLFWAVFVGFEIVFTI